MQTRTNVKQFRRQQVAYWLHHLPRKLHRLLINLIWSLLRGVKTTEALKSTQSRQSTEMRLLSLSHTAIIDVLDLIKVN